MRASSRKVSVVARGGEPLGDAAATGSAEETAAALALVAGGALSVARGGPWEGAGPELQLASNATSAAPRANRGHRWSGVKEVAFATAGASRRSVAKSGE